MKSTIVLLLALAILPFASAAPKKPDPAPPEAPAKEQKATKEKKPAENPEETRAAAKKQADTLTPAQKTKLLELLNKGESKAIEEINGIGAKRAAAIIAKRPYTAVEDLAFVDDIGAKTFANVITFGKGEQPAPVKKEKSDTTEKKVPAKN